MVFCNYFYTDIRLDVSASELFNIFLSQLASAARFSSRAEGVVFIGNQGGRQTLTVGPLPYYQENDSIGCPVMDQWPPIKGRWQVACLHFPDREVA